MTDSSKRRIRSQLALQLDPLLIEKVKAAADARGQTLTRWCSDLFEAALAEIDVTDDDFCMPDVDGVRLAELVDRLPLSRGSVFELIKVLGITTAKGPGPGGRGRVAWLTAADADRLADAAGRVHRGEVRIADLGIANTHRITLEDRISRLERTVSRLIPF